jgi:hypothetical protein
VTSPAGGRPAPPSRSNLPPYSVLIALAPWEPPGVVAEVLGSLRRQSLPPEQVVISCDGPPPPPLYACLLESGLPLLIVPGPGGEGAGPVLARGLLECHHEIVVRVDADDLSLPMRCERQVRRLHAAPWLAALSSPIAEFERDPTFPCGLRTVPCGEEQVQSFSRWRNPLNHPSSVIRRSRVLAVGNYRSKPGFEDYDLWLRLLAAGERLDNGPDVEVMARVGPAHLQRRHGVRYAGKELRFLLACGREGLIPWPGVLLLLPMRLPLRLLPPCLLRWVTQRLLRTL